MASIWDLKSCSLGPGRYRAAIAYFGDGPGPDRQSGADNRHAQIGSLSYEQMARGSSVESKQTFDLDAWRVEMPTYVRLRGAEVSMW